MTKDDHITSYKYSVIQHARKYKNITDACKLFNISRIMYCACLKRFSKLGYLGLADKVKRKPKMPNQIKKDKEMVIVKKPTTREISLLIFSRLLQPAILHRLKI